MAYITPQDVAQELQVTINKTSTPSFATVEKWITQAQEEVETVTGTSFEPLEATNVILDSNGGELLWIPTKYTPIVSMASVERNTGTDFADSWTSITEGTDFIIVRKRGGRLKFAPGLNIQSMDRAIRIGTINYGYEEVPKLVQALMIKLVARRYIQSQLSNTSVSSSQKVKIGPLEVENNSGEVVKFMMTMNEDISELWDKVGTLRVYTN